MPGLLDFASDPQGMQGLALLAAAAPSMAPQNFAGRLAQAGSNYQGLLGDQLKQQFTKAQIADMQQQIGLRGIQLQQAQQQFELMKPILGAVSAAYSNQGTPGASGPAAPAQPAIAPAGGGALGSGTFGIPMGGQSASAPAQPGAGGPGGSIFGVPMNVAGPSLALGGPAKFADTISSYNAPTDLMKSLSAQGLQPGSPEWTQAMRDFVTKSNYIAPVNARPGSILRNPTTGQPFAFNPHVPDGVSPVFDASGNVTAFNPISGALPAIAAVETAKTGGKAEATPSIGYSASGQPVYSTVGQDLRRARGVAPQLDGDPNATSTPFQRAGSDVASLQREIDGVNRSMVPAATKKMQLDILNAELMKAQAGASGAPAVGAVTPQQAPGLVPNADAAQKASAQTMQASYGRLQASNSTAQNALDVIDKMLGIASKKNPLFTAGVLGTNQSAVNPDAAEYEKQRANLITQLSAQNGTNGTDAGRALTGEAVPDFGKPKAAIADGLGTLRNQTVVQQIKANFLTPVYQAGDSKKYTTLENEFDQHISPSMVPLLTMPPGKARADALRAAAQNPTLRAKLTWAVDNGLLK